MSGFLRPDGTIGRVRRGILLGSVADLPTRRDAQLKLDERWLPINHRQTGIDRRVRRVRRAAMEGPGVADVQAHDAARRSGGAASARAADVARHSASRYRPTGGSAVGGRSLAARPRMAVGPQRVGAPKQHPRDGGRIRVSTGEPGAGREVPAEGPEEETRDDRRHRLREIESAKNRPTIALNTVPMKNAVIHDRVAGVSVNVSFRGAAMAIPAADCGAIGRRLERQRTTRTPKLPPMVPPPRKRE